MKTINKIAILLILVMFGVCIKVSAKVSPTCKVTANCYNGGDITGTVSCTGENKCEIGFEWVECDGNRSVCVH